jgi:hypothetical protein
MPARDLYHDAVRTALIKDGWTITHEPYRLIVDRETGAFVPEADGLRAAERGGTKIVVEVKDYQEPSDIEDLQRALGHYLVLRVLLERADPERQLYLAVADEEYFGIFHDPIAQPVLNDLSMSLLAFSPAREEVVAWKN